VFPIEPYIRNLYTNLSVFILVRLGTRCIFEQLRCARCRRTRVSHDLTITITICRTGRHPASRCMKEGEDFSHGTRLATWILVEVEADRTVVYSKIMSLGPRDRPTLTGPVASRSACSILYIPQDLPIEQDESVFSRMYL
jgi:hypothetical protein